MNREDRAEMLAHIWTRHLWPEQGDVHVLTLATQDDAENGVGINVYGKSSLPEMMDALLEALVGEDRVAPAWLAFTSTCYYADLPESEVERGVPPLAEVPTENTHHGLLVLMVDPEGTYSVIWEMDLEPEIHLPPVPTMISEDTDSVRGEALTGLQALYTALVMVGGE